MAEIRYFFFSSEGQIVFSAFQVTISAVSDQIDPFDIKTISRTM